MLGVSERTVRRMVADGTLPNHGSPRRIRIAIVDIEAVLRARPGHAISRLKLPNRRASRNHGANRETIAGLFDIDAKRLSLTSS